MRATTDIQKLLGQAVRQLRTTRHLTQEELSRRTGIHPTYISDIERGARNPSFTVLVRLVHGLNAPLADLATAYDKLDRSSHHQPAGGG